MRILAVDDDQIALDILGSSLEDAGYRDFVVALSGADALEAIRAMDRPFDIFLLDIQMPDIDGIELCAKVRNLPKYKSSPIIMITAMSERHFIDGAFAAGATDYVSKPFDPVELAVRISLAAHVVTQNWEIETSISEVEYLKMRSGISTNLDSTNAFDINEISRVVGVTAMENYLLRLTTGMARQSQSVAFAIDGFELLHANMSSVELYDTLTDTAEAIACGFKRVEHLITYCGNGEFVAVCHKASNLQDGSLLVDIQNTLDSFEFFFPNVNPCQLKLRKSKCYIPKFWAASNSMNLLSKPLAFLSEERLVLDTKKKIISCCRRAKSRDLA